MENKITLHPNARAYLQALADAFRLSPVVEDQYGRVHVTMRRNLRTICTLVGPGNLLASPEPVWSWTLYPLGAHADASITLSAYGYEATPEDAAEMALEVMLRANLRRLKPAEIEQAWGERPESILLRATSGDSMEGK